MNSRTSIKLSHNQVYGEVFDLKQLFNFTQPGTYVIKGMFYPIPLKYLFSENHVNFVSFQEKNKIESDYLQIEIIDEKNNNKILDVKEKIFSSNKKSNIEYSPAKIVEIILKSKMEKDWETHFSHIDLEALIQDFPNYHAIYNSTHLNYKERSKIISNFKNYLKIYFHKLGFSNFKNYTIEKTIIQNQKNRSEVHVKIEYLNKSTSFFNNYVFYLYKKNHQWLLYSYKINNFFKNFLMEIYN